jgi:hypothetical protein
VDGCWNWYVRADPGRIGANQYDFETTVVHELGQALGLGGSTNPSSPMYEALAAGVADRTPTAQDLNIPDPPARADPQRAAGFRPVAPSPIIRTAPSPGPTAVGAVAMTALDAEPIARAGGLTGSQSSGSGSSKRGSSRGTGVSPVAADGRAVRIAARLRSALQGTAVDAAPEELGALPSLLCSDGPTSSRDRARARRSVT